MPHLLNTDRCTGGRKKIGKYNIQMCTTTPCMVLGAYEVLDKIKSHLDVSVGGSPGAALHRTLTRGLTRPGAAQMTQAMTCST